MAGIGAQRVVEVLNQAGVAFSEVTTRRASLEDVYLQLTGGETEYRAAAGWELNGDRDQQPALHRPAVFGHCVGASGPRCGLSGSSSAPFGAGGRLS